jgi:hypothetical protein
MHGSYLFLPTPDMRPIDSSGHVSFCSSWPSEVPPAPDGTNIKGLENHSDFAGLRGFESLPCATADVLLGDGDCDGMLMHGQVDTYVHCQW